MANYICCHPIDDLFAAELSAQIRSQGLTADVLPSTFEHTITNSDVFVVILRPEYVQSNLYSELMSKLSEYAVIAVLRRPIKIADWHSNAVLSPVVDFTNYSREQDATSLIILIENLLACNNTPNVQKPNPIDIYLGNLRENILRLNFPIHLLEKVNYRHDKVTQTPVQTLLAANPVEVLSISQSDSVSTYRLDSLAHVAKCNESCIVICNDLDSALVTAFLTEDSYDVFCQGGSRSLPLMLDIGEWNKELLADKWLDGQISLTQITRDSLIDIRLTLYVYGFERSAVSVEQFRQEFTAWWNVPSPAPSLVIVCPSTDYLRKDPREYVLKSTEWKSQALQHLCTQYSDRSLAQFLISTAENHGLNSAYKYLEAHPILAAILLSVNFENRTTFFDFTLSDYFARLTERLWQQVITNGGGHYTPVEDGLSKIAAIMTQNQKSFIGYRDAISYLQSEADLQHCVDVGFLASNNNKVRFSLSVFQDYFASLALVKYGIPARLPSLTLNAQSERISQRWDTPILLASHISSSPDKFICQVTEHDPLLALKCVVSIVPQNAELYSYVVDKNLEEFVKIGDFRTEFARTIHTIDPSLTQSILIEVLRNASWEVRKYAYQTLQKLEFPIKPGLVESLSSLNASNQKNMSQALKRIGAEALPTLLYFLRDDDSSMRSNVLWALGQLEDKASVPALVNILSDNSLTNAAQAASILVRIQDICALPYLINHLEHRHAGARKSIVDAIIDFQEKQPDEFIKIVHQMNAAIRRQIVVYLSTSKLTTSRVDFFLEFSRDEDVDVRIAAIQALGSLRESRVIARFEECIDDMAKSRLNKSSVSEIVSRILSNIPHKDIKNAKESQSPTLNSSQIVKARLLNAKVQKSNSGILTIEHDESMPEKGFNPIAEDSYVADILAKLRSRKWDTSNNAAKLLRDHVKALRNNASSKVINQILETLNDDDWVIRWTGVESLGWVGNVHVVPHLIQRLSDSNWKVRVAAIRALAEIRDNSAVVGLAELSSDANTVVREAAAEALGFLDGNLSASALKVFAGDSEDFVRLAATESLGRINHIQAIPVLLSALKDASEHVRWAAANGLSEIADADSVPLLIPSLSDVGGPYWEQKRICDVIVDILKKINTEEAKKALAEWQVSQSQ